MLRNLTFAAVVLSVSAASAGINTSAGAYRYAATGSYLDGTHSYAYVPRYGYGYVARPQTSALSKWQADTRRAQSTRYYRDVQALQNEQRNLLQQQLRQQQQLRRQLQRLDGQRWPR